MIDKIMKRYDNFARQEYISYRRTPSFGRKAAAIGLLAGISFGIFDQLRSIGQNTEADSLMDHARIVVVKDFNVWEQFKDYVAPQDESQPIPIMVTPVFSDQPEQVDFTETNESFGAQVDAVTVTRNEHKAPLFDPYRSADFGHILIAGGLTAVSITAKLRNRES